MFLDYITQNSDPINNLNFFNKLLDCIIQNSNLINNLDFQIFHGEERENHH